MISWQENKSKRFILKIISLTLIIAFCSITCCYGLAPLSTSQNPVVKREIRAALQRTQIRYAESEDAVKLLKANNASCLLLSSGKYLVTKEVAQDDIKLLRAIIHEDIEAIMQIIAKEDRYKYQGIKELILKYFPPGKSNNFPIDLYVNHTIARAFEWLVLLEDDIVVQDEIPPQELIFINAIKPILRANKHNYFTSEFWDSGERNKRIKLALNKGMRFYQVTSFSQIDNTPSNDIARKQRFDSLFFRDGNPTGYFRNLARHFDTIKALVEGKSVNPVSIEMQPSGTCNINCRYCGFKEKRLEHAGLHISKEEMEKLIEDIDVYNKAALYPLTEIKFNGIFSEPLAGAAKEATVTGIREAVRRGFLVGLYTNGICLDDAVSEALIGNSDMSASFVNISLDAGSWEIYRKLKRSAVDEKFSRREYKLIVDNIRSLVSKRNRTGSSLQIYISCILQKENCTPEEIEKIVKLAKELGVDGLRFRYPYKKPTGAPREEAIKTAYAKIAELKKAYSNDGRLDISEVYPEGETYDLMKGLFEGPLQEKSYSQCRVPYLRMTVGPDGNFYPCDHRGYIGGGVLGHISQGYSYVVESLRRKQVLNSINPRDDKRCEFCAMYNHYMNGLLEFLSNEYKNDTDIFSWIEGEYEDYLRDKETVSELKKMQKILHGIVEKTKKRDMFKELLLYVERLLRDSEKRKSYRHMAKDRKSQMAKREPLKSSEYFSNLSAMVSNANHNINNVNSFAGYKAEGEYNPYEFVNFAFRDEGFLKAAEILGYDNAKKNRINISEEEELVLFIKDFLGKRGETPEAISACLNDMLSAMDMIVALSDSNVSAKIRDSILKLLPGFVIEVLDKSFNEPSKKYSDTSAAEFLREREVYFKTFCDLLIEIIHYKIGSMKSYHAYLSRQLLITLHEFEEKLSEYTGRIGFSKDFQPVIILSDAEPLTYPFLGLLGDSDYHNPELLYFTRLTCMTETERQRCQAEGLNERSFYSRAAFALETKLYKFLRGDKNKGVVSVIDESAREALTIAKTWFFEYLGQKDYGNIKDTATKRAIYDAGQKHFQNDTERLFTLIFTKKLLALMDRDPEVKQVLNRIYSQVIPEGLKNDKKKNIVFIDSGIRGSLPALLAGIIYINEIPGSSTQSKLRYIDSIISDQKRLESKRMRVRLFMYGVEPQLYSVIPNAGFPRFGHGGSNSLIDEQSPKSVTFDSIADDGTAQCRISDEFERHKASIVISGLKELQSKEDKIKHASSVEDIENIVVDKIGESHEPIYIFMDLDNVVFRPLGYIGSEQWYRDAHGALPPADEKNRRSLAALNKRHDRRLQRSGCYEMVCDVKHLKDRFRDREIKVIGISSRGESQRKVTESILQDLGILAEFDQLDFIKIPGPTKKERIRTYLEKSGIIKRRKSLQLFIVDDATHNLYPFLAGEDPDIMPILFKPAEGNYKGYGSVWFFEEAAASSKKDERLKSKEMSLNALNDDFMELTSKDIMSLGELYQDNDGVIERLLKSINDSFGNLQETARNRIEDMLIDLIYSNISKESLKAIAKTVMDINRKYNKFSKAKAIFTELIENTDYYVSLFSVLKGIETDEKTKVYYKKLSEGEIAHERKRAREEALAEILEGLSYNKLPESSRAYLKRLIKASIDLIDVKHSLYDEVGGFKEIISREYVFDGHGNIIQQYKKTHVKIDRVHTEIKVDLTDAVRFITNRLWIIDDIKIYSGIREEEYRGPQINKELIGQASRTKKIPIEAIHDKRLLRFMQFLKKHNLRNVVIIGGGVRDALFMEMELADIDTALKMKLSDEERNELRAFFSPSSYRIHSEAMKELDQMARALGFQNEDFLKHLVHSTEPYKPHFEDLEVSYVGPISTKTLDGREDTFIVRILFDADTHEELSFNSGIGLLKLGIDMDGNIYGHADSLKDLLEGKVRLFGDGTNFRLGEILRFLRLKYEFGLKIDPISYGIIKWKLDEYRKKRLTLPKIVLYDAKRQVERILDHTIDKDACRKEMEQLGVSEIIDMSVRGELEIDKVLTNHYEKVHEAIRTEKRKPRVLLVNSNIAGVNNFIPPIGLYSLRAALDKFAKAEVHILDLAVGSIKQKDIEKRLKKSVKRISPDVVGISFTTPSCKNAFRAAEIVRMTKENTIIIAGGVHPSAVPERDVLNGKAFDCVLKGEAEYSISQLVNTIKETAQVQEFLRVKGLSLKYNNVIFQGEVAEPILNIDTLPTGLLTEEELQQYHTWIIEPTRKAIPIFGSRGCPYGCTFCSKAVFGEHVRMRSVRNILDEIEYYYNTGWRNFTFVDDAFGINPRRIEEFCDILMEEGLDISWRATFRVDAVSPQILKKMSRAGCVSVAFGLESGSEKIRNEIAHKKTTQEQNYRAVQWAKAAGIEEVKLFIMVGLPDETEDDVWETIRFIKKADPTNIGLSVATLFPGSQWFREIDLYHTQIFGDAEMLLPYTKVGNTGKYTDKQPEVAHETATLGREKISLMYGLVKKELAAYLYDTDGIKKHFIADKVRLAVQQLYDISLEDIVGNIGGLQNSAIQKRFGITVKQLMENYETWRRLDRKESKICEEVGFKDGCSQADFILLNFILASLLSSRLEYEEGSLLEGVNHHFFKPSSEQGLSKDKLIEEIKKVAELSYITYLLAQEQISCDTYDNIVDIYKDAISHPVLKDILNRLLTLGASLRGKIDYQELIKILRNDPTIEEESQTVDIDYIYLHITQYCNLGCRHCGGDAIPIPTSGRMNRRYILSKKGVGKVIQLLNSGYQGEIITAGGGEPTLEFASIVEVAKLSKCATVLIVTNGSFGSDKLRANTFMEELLKVIELRGKDHPLEIKICISVDKYHQEKLPIQAVKNIIDAKLELENKVGRKVPVEIILKTLHGFDGPLFELAQLYNTDYSPLTEDDDRDVAKLSIGHDTVLNVQYAKFMTKSAKSKHVVKEVPEELLVCDTFPIEGIPQYRIGGVEGKLDIRIFEDGDVVSGREGRSNLVIGNIYKEDMTVQSIKETVIADPIIRALREDGLEYLIEVAISIYPELRERIEKVKAQMRSFLIERILHVVVEDDFKKMAIAYKILKDHPQWKSSKYGISAIEAYALRRHIAIQTGRQYAVSEIIAHQANDIIKGFHVDEAREKINDLHSETLNLPQSTPKNASEAEEYNRVDQEISIAA